MEEICEERTAIMLENNMPEELVNSIIRLQLMPKSEVFSDQNLDKILSKYDIFIEEGWGIYDLFGAHSTSPLRRYDAMGLIITMEEGDEIVSITREYIRLKNSRGYESTFPKPSNKTEQILIWEL